MATDPKVKDPVKQRAARASHESRYGDHTVDLRDLRPAYRRLIKALIDAAEHIDDNEVDPAANATGSGGAVSVARKEYPGKRRDTTQLATPLMDSLADDPAWQKYRAKLTPRR